MTRYAKPTHEVLALRSENARLRGALEDIVSPLAAIKRKADAEGYVLSGMAYSISRDPNHLQSIAREALAKGQEIKR